MTERTTRSRSMRDRGLTMPGLRPKPVLVLGTDDIASAVGHALASVGVAVLLARDPEVPVLRRGMSFDDALERGSFRVDGVTAYAATPPPLVPADAVLAVTALPIQELMDPALIEGVIDARMRRGQHKPDLRGDLGFAIGLGPGFTAGTNVDIAVETAPDTAGLVLREGATSPALGEAMLLGAAGGQRLARAPRSGIWWTFRDVGELVEDGAVVGLCAGMQVPAPLAGYLSGLVRRGTTMRAGMRLLEVDPRGRDAQCHGISPWAATVAAGSLAALHQLWRSPRRPARQEVVRWLT